MVNSWVERATSDSLIGPDWAMNMEISALINSDPTQAKDIVKGLKKRLRSKNPNVLLLTLTLLDTVVKNCGEVVHIHVAEKNVPSEMFKLVKKKTDNNVKEKILIIIDTWQESFGGPRARYPQFYSVYQNLLLAGVVFPKRHVKPAPDTTQANIPTNLRNLDSQQDTSQSEADFPCLSLTEIQNAHSITDVLNQMLNAIDPQNKEGFREEVVVDLVEKCQTYKQRVVHLLHTTSDENLLCEGINLTEELQQLLAKYQALTSGNPLLKEQLKHESNGVLVSGDAPLIDTGDDTVQPVARAAGSGVALSDLFAVAAPSTNNGWTNHSINQNPKVDLLSGDDFNSPKVENSLALVPTEELRPSSPTSQQNALVLADFYTQTTHMDNPADLQHAYQAEQAQSQTPGLISFQSSQPIFSSFENTIVSGSAQHEPSVHANGTFAISDWNRPTDSQQLTQSSHGAQSEESFPAPPWETQPAQSDAPEAQHPQMQEPAYHDTMHTQVYSQSAVIGQMSPGMYMQPFANGIQSTPNYQASHPHQVGGQLMGMFPTNLPAGHQLAASMYQQHQYYNNYQTGAYGQFQQGNQMLNQQMYGLSIMGNNGGLRTSNSSQVSTVSSYLPPMRPKPKPEDGLFGDLVDLNKFKSGKPTLI